MDLSNLKPNVGSTKNRKRVGRGPGSGHGKTSGQGHKGQKARSGYKSRAWSEGGQMPLARRVPKRGFTNIFRVEYLEVNIGDLKKITAADITPQMLHEVGLVKGKNRPIKILADGVIERPVTITAHAFTKAAVEKIEKAGGKTIKIEKQAAKETSKSRKDGQGHQ